MEETEEKKQLWLFAKLVFGVLYSPKKAFKAIVKKPDIKGPFLLLMLVSLLGAGTLYVSGSKILIVQPTTEIDSWTEPEALGLWTSNGNRTADSTDTIVGNASIVSSISEGLTIWLNLTNIGQFNCTQGNLSVLTFYIKWVNPRDTPPSTATLAFSSGSSDDKFELDITDLISRSSDRWTYLAIDVDSKNVDFAKINSPDWANITDMEFLLEWTDTAADVEMKIDSVFFGEYILLSGTPGFLEIFVPSFSILTVLDFFLKWVLFSAGLWLVLRSFTDRKSPFRDLFYVTGYCFSGLLVYVLIRLFSFLLISPLSPGISVVYPLYISLFVFNAWPVALGAFALREMHSFSGRKAALLSISAYFVYFFVTMAFLFGISPERALFTLP